MSKEIDTLCFIYVTYHPIIVATAAAHGHRLEVMAGILMRETEGGLSRYLDKKGPEGRGDFGHGHGLFQIDDRSFPEFCASEDWKDPLKNAMMAGSVLNQKRIALKVLSRQKGLVIADPERASIAAYNCGEGNVIKVLSEQRDVDAKTAHGNYSADVLRLAGEYVKIINTELGRTIT